MDVMNLMATLGLDSSEFEEGLEKSVEEGSTFGEKLSGVLKGAGKIGVSALKAIGQETIKLGKQFVDIVGQTASFGDNIDKMSQKMGLSASAYQEWDFVLQHSGSSIESMRAGMRTLVNASQNGSEAFKTLGMSQEEIANMSQEELFGATIRALQNVEDETQRTYLASQLLGRGAMELGPLLNTSSEDLDAMLAQVHELGGVMSDEAVKASAAYQDSLQNLNTALDGAKHNLTAEYLPGFVNIMDGLTGIFIGDNGAAASIVEGIYKIVDKMREMAPAIVKNIKNIIKKIMPALKVALKAIAEVLRDLFPIVVDLLSELVPIITGNLPGFITSILPPLLSALGQLMASIVTNLPQILSALWDGLKSALGAIWTSLSGLDWIQLGKNILSWIVGALSDLGTKILGFLGVPTDEEGNLEISWSGLGTKIAGWITGAFESVKTFFSNLFKPSDNSGDETLWKTIVDNISTWIHNTLDNVKTFVKGLLGIPDQDSTTESGWTTAASNIGTWITEALSGVRSFLDGLLGAPKAEEANEEGETPWQTMARTLGETITGALGFVVDFLHDIFCPPPPGEQKTTEEQWQTFATNIDNAITTAFTVSSELISGVFTAAQNAIENFPFETVGKNLGTLAGNIANVALNTFDGIFTSAGAAIEAFDWAGTGTKLGELATQLGAVAIKSISRVFTMADAAIDAFPWEDVGRDLGILSGQIAELPILGISGIFTLGKSAINNFPWEEAGKDIAGLLGQFEGLTADTLSAIFTTAQSTINSINWEALGVKVGKLTETVVGIPLDALSGIFSTTDSVIRSINWNDLGETIANGLSRAWGIVAGLGDIALGAGESVVMAGQQGVRGLKSWIQGWFGDEEVEVEVTPIPTPEEIKALEDAITTAGENGSTNMQNALILAGSTAATSIQTDIQKALDAIVVPDFSGGRTGGGGSSGGGAGRNHATAMDSGEILKRVTPFGYDQRGNVHYAGDAGPEAVVGVNSLHQMIQKSVQSALSHLQPAQQPTKVQLVLDTGVLLGEVDVGLSERADWRGGGRA